MARSCQVMVVKTFFRNQMKKKKKKEKKRKKRKKKERKMRKTLTITSILLPLYLLAK